MTVPLKNENNPTLAQFNFFELLIKLPNQPNEHQITRNLFLLEIKTTKKCFINMNKESNFQTLQMSHICSQLLP
jgi:hypothetical protein